MSKFCLGKKAPRKLLKTPAFGDYLDKRTTWPSVVAQGWEYCSALGRLDCLANERLSDCAPAGAMHLIQAETANAGNPLHATEQQTIDLYSAVTGYNPNDPNTDQGTCLIDLLKYWKNEGIKVTDSSGRIVTHKILGWASLDLSSIAQMRYASYIFGGTYLGIRCPQSAEDDTSNWKYQDDSPIIGGHCINGVGQGADGGHVISWGMSIPFNWAFMLNYLDEGYAVVSQSWLNAQGKSPSGLDLNGLLDAIKKL
jgi:hypothetical protein